MAKWVFATLVVFLVLSIFITPFGAAVALVMAGICGLSLQFYSRVLSILSGIPAPRLRTMPSFRLVSEFPQIAKWCHWCFALSGFTALFLTIGLGFVVAKWHDSRPPAIEQTEEP